MKKQHTSKLALNRETLAALSANDLHDVNGGTGSLIRTTVKVSQWLCTTVTTVQSQRIITCK
jgi:hypothetical protein